MSCVTLSVYAAVEDVDTKIHAMGYCFTSFFAKIYIFLIEFLFQYFLPGLEDLKLIF